MELTGRITQKKLMEWLNFKFKEFEIQNYVVFEVCRTYHTSAQYEAGACKLIIRFKDLKGNNTGSFLSMYGMKDIGDYVKKGYSVYLKMNTGRYGTSWSLTDFEIDVRKK